MQMDIKEQDQMYIAHTYHRFDVVLTKGSCDGWRWKIIFRYDGWHRC